MARIAVEDITVDYPLYNADSMSLRNRLVAVGTGGRISRYHNVITVKALDGVSFSMADGDRVALLGHNGAGKTTLLRTLAGIYFPTTGRIDVQGRISTMFELSAGLGRELTGYENIVRMSMLLGASRREAEAMIPEIEAFTDLGEFLAVPIHTYSTGMLARLTFAVATGVKPDILLIDEVIGAGDADFQRKAEERIRQIISTTKILVFATHAQELVDLYCNRILRFEQGRLIEDVRLDGGPAAPLA